ncbi:TlyA family rRNA (cytidine-2'-O)-methyltransferase, partial [Candidatus Peregrinibacteria bacterium]|nr:TlyA family rRNA (cytidine-2'-O)-methyltransferase [Candidatus Peregrinibacteria bacterium]
MESFRLDQMLVKKGLVASRDRAKEMILAGKCSVNGKVVKKCSVLVVNDAAVLLSEDDIPYVSRGGLKLAAAIEKFGINVEGKVCLDIGVATGGFTDCLLQKGARKVFAVDVGKGQLHEKLLQDERVRFLNETDARNLNESFFDEPIDLCVVDVSFI